MPRLARQFIHRWRRMSRLDRTALVIVFLYTLERLARSLGWKVPSSLGGLFGFLGVLFFLAAIFLAVRLVRIFRGKILWRLRNRLIVAYVFIAVVPVLLLLTMAGIVGYLVYMQLGSYLISQGLEERRQQVASIADDVAALVARGVVDIPKRPSEAPSASSWILGLEQAARRQLPGLRIRVIPLNERPGKGETANERANLFESGAAAANHRLARLIQRENELRLESSVAARAPSGALAGATATVPLTSELLDTLAPELGSIQLTLTKPASDSNQANPANSKVAVISQDGRRWALGAQISTRRPPQAAQNWFDVNIRGATILKVDRPDLAGSGVETSPMLATFSVRRWSLNQRLFASLGGLGEPLVVVLMIIGAIFLVLEVTALITGIVLTRTITQTVDGLYAATERVKAGDFSHRVRTERKDQLGALGESFNAMTSAIVSLLEEQRQKQRLENELSIAREVQEQLFPRALPSLPGLRLAAVCRAARVVSGDYYDFLQLGPTRVGIAVGDISGKGISAALVMASLQSALRSQVLLDGTGGHNTADLVLRLNRHLLLNTSDDRYATFFYGVFDSATRTLHYTNAGHVPPLYVVGNRVTKLEEGGTVIGLLEDSTYEQGILQIEPGGVLVAYSDGVVEPENVYGEQFGMQRLIDEVLRARDAPPERVVEDLVTTVSTWSGSPEQSDDMTVLVARMD